MRRQACKPNSVEDGHSSRHAITGALQRPTRRFPLHSSAKPLRIARVGAPGPARTRRQSGRAARFPPYLVLLRVGFTLPPPLPSERCALTAPFHPYPALVRAMGGIFSVALAVLRPLRRNPGRYPAHCPAEFGLSSPGTKGSGSGRPAHLQPPSYL